MAGEVRYRFRVKNKDGKELLSDVFAGPPHPVQVHTVLRDENGEPHAGLDYILRGGGVTKKGKSGAGGEIANTLPAGTETCELEATLHDDDHATIWELELSAPPPIEQIAGVQVRLNQAGFNAGPATNSMNDQTRRAILELQHQLGVANASGEIDDATRKALIAMTEP